LATTEAADKAEGEKNPRIETVVHKGATTTLGENGSETRDESSTTLDLGAELDADLEAEDQDGADKADDEGDKDVDPSGDDDLPDFDPDNEESVKVYEERYFKDGVLNKDALSDLYWKNYEAAGGDVSKAGLGEKTYQYLEKALGISREMAKQTEAALVGQHIANERAFIETVGGVERYNAAVTWAKEGGYTEEQRERFRRAFAKGGEDKQEAVDALMARFERSSGGASSGRRGPPRRDASPRRDATGSAATGRDAEPGFKTRAEYDTAWKEGLAARREARQSGDKLAIKKAEDHLTALQRKVRRSFK
jgi:hypothetical protein